MALMMLNEDGLHPSNSLVSYLSHVQVPHKEVIKKASFAEKKRQYLALFICNKNIFFFFCRERGWAQQLVVSLWWQGLPAGWSAASSPSLVGDPEYWHVAGEAALCMRAPLSVCRLQEGCADHGLCCHVSHEYSCAGLAGFMWS